ncbi:unnamed protein product [Rotaria magnacalcarata]|uniref:RHD domain-containing protein n=2 Tax=Rotaria magnacalcarata TaxID=392030 RepID=A0A816MXL4_9BILA|nr:unnamed protein product [Rotaria magnacalcarata]CAF1685354.1 unnamed protein product [Rotaria magnacalcarata]CAF2022299.1 unnamed protein product [Rotaria magnacalcarata]CAF2112346.1 unnamed protein product [Rotaria magnacalcarata]CAF3758501.1 unnamed protein product [Rotaria magnacalcarata]
MDENFDLDNILESMNLTGQHQASGLTIIRDSSLDDQILGDIYLSEEDLLAHSHFTINDDISNALIDNTIDEFAPFTELINPMAESSIENDEIGKFISTPLGEMPRQSTIEETLERININQSHTDTFSSAIAFQIGSSPVEHKIDNSILATHFVQQQQRIIKNASKARKSSKYQQPSSNVGPIDILTSYGGCQPCTTAQMEDDYDIQQQILQCDSIESKKIQIKSQPRPKFRPRTHNESKNASHYIRCEINDQHDYPTIYIPHIWALQSVKNVIEVTLVGKDYQPHPYTLENKTSSTSIHENALIFRQNVENTLYFSVTNEDFKNGYKSFMLEYIKSKQDAIITKELIKTRQLDQSMLRFTRIYQTEKDIFQRDDGSTQYSNVMVEAYGDISVEHMGPKYGPISGNEGVYILLKGRIVKEDITVFVTENTTGWRRQLPFTKNSNLIYFSMPAYPFSGTDKGIVNITICYKGEELYQTPYLYQGSLDQALAELNLNDSTSAVDTSPICDAFDFFSVTGACPIRISSRKSSTAKTAKRLNTKQIKI